MVGFSVRLIEEFAERLQLPPDSVRRDGSLVLTTDGIRAYLMPSAHERIMLKSNLVALPVDLAARAQAVQKLTKLAGALIRDYGVGCGLADQSLWLLHLLPSRCSLVDLDMYYADFLNVLSFVRRAALLP